MPTITTICVAVSKMIENTCTPRERDHVDAAKDAWLRLQGKRFNAEMLLYWLAEIMTIEEGTRIGISYGNVHFRVWSMGTSSVLLRMVSYLPRANASDATGMPVSRLLDITVRS